MKRALAFCAAVLASCTVAEAGGDQDYLKGITTIQYSTYFENQLSGKQCAVDQENWKTTLAFVANQSAKLKFIPGDEHSRRVSELSAKSMKLVQEITPSGKGEPEWQIAQKELEDYTHIPRLWVNVISIATVGGCAGTLEAKLQAHVMETRIVGTNAPIFAPMIEIWNEGRILSSPPSSFSDDMIKYGEMIMKQLVNDWTYSQKELKPQ